ncbi:MAG: glycosyltransferase family 39 protein [Candidatus Promineifilaceae bacterium]|nr:glycosyltransferase family 39 protein [Candidatus Promineifilaceae bacterium]
MIAQGNSTSLRQVMGGIDSHFERKFAWSTVVILLLMFGLALFSMAQKAPTFDEQGFIVRGLAYLRGHKQIRVGHPLGLNAANAIFLVQDDQVDLPLGDPSWQGTSFHRPAELFLWEIGNDVDHIMFLARLPTIWIGLLLAALTATWTKNLAGRRWPAIIALTFIAFDPNILAHTRLATTDLGLAAFAFLAAYTLWRFLKSPGWRNILFAGIAMGLLQNTKFTANLFVPLFALVVLIALVHMWIERLQSKKAQESAFSVTPWRPILMVLFLYPLTAVITLWAANGFEIATMPADLPMLSFLAGKTLPLANHLEQILDISGRLRVVTPSFLLGQYSESGWWYYFPVAFLLKTPLPTLILIILGFGAYMFCVTRNKRRGKCLTVVDSAALLIPAIGYFAIAITSDINLGYRHILPVLPFLVAFSTTSMANVEIRKIPGTAKLAALLLAIGLAVVACATYPDFLSYFNILAGGPQNGWRSLVDSNLDWGQDLDDLPEWMANHGVEEVWLSYFGEARPEYYGISYRGLDSFPPRLMNPRTRPYYPFDPAPGFYAISATNLQGVHFTNHQQFAWFWNQNPVDSLGHSIYIYQIFPRGESVSLLLSGVQIDELRPDDYRLLGSNDVNPRWIDISQSLILPNDSNVWLVIDSEEQPHPEINPYLMESNNIPVVSADYKMARLERPSLPEQRIADFSYKNGHILLREVSSKMVDGRLEVVSQWEQIGEKQPLKLFVHLIDSDGEIVSQWDGLGIAWEGWLPDDRLIQVHELSLAENDSEGEVLLLGAYDPQTGERWVTGDGADYFEIGSYSLP